MKEKPPSDMVVLEMRCGSKVSMAGFPRCHQPLNTTCHPCWKWTDVPRSSVQNYLGSVSSLYASMNTYWFLPHFRTLSSLSWRIPSIFWRPKIQRPKKSSKGLSVIRKSRLKVQNTLQMHNMTRTVVHLKSFPSRYSIFSLFPWCLEMLINRQNSSESISSLTSTTSMGSLKEQEAKKKKKKSWVRTHRFEILSGVSEFCDISVWSQLEKSQHTVLRENYFAVVHESDVFWRLLEEGRDANKPFLVWNWYVCIGPVCRWAVGCRQYVLCCIWSGNKRQSATVLLFLLHVCVWFSSDHLLLSMTLVSPSCCPAFYFRSLRWVMLLQ